MIKYKEFNKVYNQNILHDMVISGDKKVHNKISGNINAHPKTLSYIYDNNSKLHVLNNKILINLASNISTPKHILYKLANHIDDDIKGYLASNNSTPSDILSKLSENKNKFIREKVAKNKNTSKDVLEKLSNDDKYSVRSVVAGNPSTHPSTLEKLSNDDNYNVMYKVARNINTLNI